MAVAIVDSMALVQRPAGTITPEQAGQIAPPNVFTPELTPSIAPPNVLIPIDPLAPPYPLGHARILYDNSYSSATASPTAGQVITIPNTFERWMPADGSQQLTLSLLSATTIDAVGIGAHNLGSAGTTILIESSPTAGGSFSEVATVTPDNDRAILVLLTNAITSQRIRLTITGGTAREIGVVYAGEALVMQRPIFGGHTPINLASKTDYQSSVSDSGNWLGRSIVRKGLSTSYNWQLLTDDWYREYFEPFVQAAKLSPFFIAWRPDQYPNEVAYCWTTADINPSNRGGGTKYMSVSINVEGHGDR